MISEEHSTHWLGREKLWREGKCSHGGHVGHGAAGEALGSSWIDKLLHRPHV
jgi:hypothetical protein